jgi:hypothetical protein
MTEEVDEELLSLKQIERLKQQDERFRDLDLKLVVENELRNSRALQIVLAAAGEQAAEALEALAAVDPTDTKLIIRLQATVFRARFVARTFTSVLRKGDLAEQSIQEDTAIQLDEGDQR